jgi:tape measure domain-containing protein
MSGFTAGRVMVPVVPDMRGFQTSVGREATKSGGAFTQNFDKSTRSGMRKVGSGITSTLKKTIKVGGVATAITAGFAIKGGISRLMGIEDARASLTGLGHDAKAVDKIMANALASVKGTAFGMADAGKIAASSVAAGIKPGRELTRHLKLVADAATIAKVPLSEMGGVFNKVAASNKVQGDVINQLNDKGIPIVQLLSKQLRISAEDVYKLSQKGQIDFKAFSSAMRSGLGGASQESGKTMSGAFANMKAALGRVGANLLSGFFPQVRGGIQGITDKLGPLEDKAMVVGTALGNFTRDAVRNLKKVGKRLGGFTLDTDKFDGEAFGTKLAAGIGVGLGKLGGLAKDLTARFGQVAKKVDWAGLGIEFGRAAVPLVTGLALGILSYNPLDLFKVLADNWEIALISALTLVLAPSKLLAPIGRVVGKIPLVGPLVVWLAKGFRTAGRSALGFAGELVRNLYLGFRNGMGWFGPSIASRLLGALRGAFPALKRWGAEFAMRLGDLFRYGLFRAGDWIAKGVTSNLARARGFVTGIFRMYAGSGKWLVQSGKDLLVGLGRGVVGTLPWLGRALSKVPSAIGNVVRGIKSRWDGLKAIMAKPVNWVIDNVVNRLINAVNSVTSKIGGKRIPPVGRMNTNTTAELSDRGMASRGGQGGRGTARRAHPHRHTGGAATKLSRQWPANTRTLSANYPGHSGIDIAAAGGTPIMAASRGRVEYTGWGRGFGQAIFVRGADGLLQIYGHASKVLTRAGAMVGAGTRLGLVGSTGNSTGDHLHFEIARNAPGTPSNRAATLAWLRGAKMGKAGPSPLDRLKGLVGKVGLSGAPKDSWFSIGNVTRMLKGGVLRGGRALLSKVNPFGGIGGKRKPKRPPSLSSRLRASRRREKLLARRIARSQDRARRSALRRQLTQQRRRTRSLERRVITARKLSAANKMATKLSSKGRESLLAPSTALTLSKGAAITSGFLTQQMNTDPASAEQLRQQYVAAQSKLSSAGNNVAAANRRLELARARAYTGQQRIGDISRALKGRRSEKALKTSLSSAETRVANARYRLSNAKTSTQKRDAKRALDQALRNRNELKSELALVRRLQAEKKRLETSKQAKELTAAEKARTAALAAQTAAQEKATTAAEAYRAAQDAAIERATNVKNIGIGLGSISSASFKTAGGITANLRKAVATTTQWGAVVKALIAAGLRGPILSEFINAGPSTDAIFTGKSLLASGGIGVINDLQNQLKKAATDAAVYAGMEYTDAGATGPAGSWSTGSNVTAALRNFDKYRQAGTSGPSVSVTYSGMPADTVDSITTKTATKVVDILSRPGA